MNIQLRDKPFNPWQELHGHQETIRSIHGKYGATSVFVGTMRDINQNDSVVKMFLESYPEMTNRYLENVLKVAHDKWQLLDALVLHRVGNVKPEETIVLIAVWSEHRAEAFEACRYIIEELKQGAPFWKKETLADQSERWVTVNTRNAPSADPRNVANFSNKL